MLETYQKATDQSQNYSCHVKHFLLSQIFNLIQEKIKYVCFQHTPKSIRPNRAKIQRIKFDRN
jgi:hypothetical protein